MNRLPSESANRIAAAIAHMLATRKDNLRNSHLENTQHEKISTKDTYKETRQKSDPIQIINTRFSSESVYNQNKIPFRVKQRSQYTQKHNELKHYKKTSIQPISDGTIPLLIAAKQPQSFAMPPNLNLNRVFHARPHLKRARARGPSRLGRIPPETTSSITEVTTSFPVMHHAFIENNSVEENEFYETFTSIRSQTKLEPIPVELFNKISPNSVPSEAYVSAEGIWTVDLPQIIATTMILPFTVGATTSIPVTKFSYSLNPEIPPPTKLSQSESMPRTISKSWTQQPQLTNPLHSTDSFGVEENFSLRRTTKSEELQNERLQNSVDEPEFRTKSTKPLKLKTSSLKVYNPIPQPSNDENPYFSWTPVPIPKHAFWDAISSTQV